MAKAVAYEASEFSCIWTHKWAHLDEMVAIYLLRRHGESVYPGISTAEILYWDMAHPALRQDAGPLWVKGVFPIGVTNGPFNEHAGYNPKEKRIENRSACDLVAIELKVRHDPDFERLLDAVSRNDLQGVGNEFMSLSRSIELRWRMKVHPDLIMDWIIDECDLRVYHSDDPLPANALQIHELLGAYLLSRYGGAKYAHLSEYSVEDWCQEVRGANVLNVLVDELNLYKVKELRQLLQGCSRVQAGVSSDILSLAHSVELRFQAGQSLVDIVEWLFYEFDLRVAQQRKVWSDEVGRIAKTAQYETIRTRGGRDLVLCTVVCEDDAVVDRIRATNRPSIVLRFNPTTGHTTILADVKQQIWLEGALRRLREQELVARRLAKMDRHLLEKMEKIEMIPWFGHRNQRWLLNIFCGGPRAMMTEPSALEWGVQKWLLIEGLKEDYRKP